MMSNREQMGTVLSLNELAARWKVGRTSLWRIIKEFDLRPFIEHPKRFLVSDIERIERERQIAPK